MNALHCGLFFFSPPGCICTRFMAIAACGWVAGVPSGSVSWFFGVFTESSAVGCGLSRSDSFLILSLMEEPWHDSFRPQLTNQRDLHHYCIFLRTASLWLCVYLTPTHWLRSKRQANPLRTASAAQRSAWHDARRAASVSIPLSQNKRQKKKHKTKKNQEEHWMLDTRIASRGMTRSPSIFLTVAHQM